MKLKEELESLYQQPSVFKDYTTHTRIIHDKICSVLDHKVKAIVEKIIGIPITNFKRNIYSNTLDIQYESDNVNVTIYNTNGYIIFSVLCYSPISYLPGKINYFKIEVDEDFDFVSATFEKRINMNRENELCVFIKDILFTYVLTNDMKIHKRISFTSSNTSLDPVPFYFIHGPFKLNNEFDDIVFKVFDLYYSKKDIYQNLFGEYVDIAYFNRRDLQIVLEMLYDEYTNTPELLYSKLNVVDMLVI